ncbi:MAG: hypothetical protein EKK64_04295 [Neisseriaceae bacterium]|nr:MAG: hypothetical protein EKK64_04295 [Neisseriaceae bacterium]
MSQLSFLFQEKDGTINISYQENVKDVSPSVKEIGEVILNLVKEVQENGYLNYSGSGIFAQATKKHLEDNLKEHKCCGGKCKKQLSEEELKTTADVLSNKVIEQASKKFKCNKENCCSKVEEQKDSFVSIEIDLVEGEISVGIRSNPAIDIQNPMTEAQTMALMLIDNLSKTYNIC